ncbi:MAG: alpha/beta hydrolase [Bacteroidia bacterium]
MFLRLILVFLFSLGILRAQEQTVVLKTKNGDISGSLLLPAAKAKVPLVIIIAGSGPTDRNGNQSSAENNSLKFLAEGLAKSGIASLRYDKRGIGESSAAIEDELSLRFGTYVSDVNDWISLMAADKRFSKIIVAGHSEGSLLGMIAAAKDSRVRAFISIAGVGRPADEVLKEQLSKVVQPVKEIIFSMIDTLKKGDTISSVPVSLYALFRPGIQPYMISWFRYDPQEEIKKLSVPVLILQGSTDVQVSEADAELLYKAYPGAIMKIIPDMNHVLKESKVKDLEAQKPIYADPALPLNRELVPGIVAFIKKIP